MLQNRKPGLDRFGEAGGRQAVQSRGGFIDRTLHQGDRRGLIRIILGFQFVPLHVLATPRLRGVDDAGCDVDAKGESTLRDGVTKSVVESEYV